ncbi:DUF2970 domain-containing protein [Burkholderia sp. Ac-20379]|uniref:DUF2970 domain-containing protein n=1 Tax=Burkholderia sp. Ac-20379 TaxID=2703900 RepID=UPI0019805052|nr:DUF2970 domain-containing protein [Burkholderia sp. Ac-20379]MBN3726932.1 DUF2970 domain-containing protein [Burkholderia sp. Ac-20379]
MTQGSIGKTLKAVLWSFFGVRKRSDLEADAQSLNPLHVLLAALIAAALFIGALLLIVRAVVG